MNESISFKNILSNNFYSNSREYIYSEIGDENYAIRNSSHKYIHFENGSEALYNLIDNEFENPNLLSPSQLPLPEKDSLIKINLLNMLSQIRSD